MKTITKDVKPKCPHCEVRLEHLVVIKSGWFANNQVYCCPECEKIISVASTIA